MSLARKMRVGIMLLLLSLITVSSPSPYRCSGLSDYTMRIEGKTGGEIITLEEGQRHYSNNQECVWLIKAQADEKIKLMVKSSNLQWSPTRSICLQYDHVDIRDKNGSLASWCGRDFPKEIISRDNSLKIIFKTDESNPRGKYYSGVKMRFQTYDNTTCPPGWLTYRKSCYTVTATKQHWDTSQRVCNLQQSNLLIVESEEELDFLYEKILNSSMENYFWVGLNDIADKGRMRWIDNSWAKGFKNFEIPEANSYRHCGVIHTGKARVFMQECDSIVLRAVCEANMTKGTDTYSIPIYGKDKGSDSTVGRTLIVAVFIPLVIIITLLLVVFCCPRAGKLPCATERRASKSKNVDDQEETAYPLSSTTTA